MEFFNVVRSKLNIPKIVFVTSHLRTLWQNVFGKLEKKSLLQRGLHLRHFEIFSIEH